MLWFFSDTSLHSNGCSPQPAGNSMSDPNSVHGLESKNVNGSNNDSSIVDSSGSSSSANSSFNLERSQSLRISKRSLRSLSSKGGSLRLSKKDAANALKQVKEECTENQPQQPSTSKTFERKNSFLSKLFNGGSGSHSSSTASNTSKKSSQIVKPVLATFSAQFPPPELQPLSPDPNAIYQQLIPASQRPPRTPQRPPAFMEANNNGASPMYGIIRSPGPPANMYDTTNLYQAPPPPLPYRPPPPNPYLNSRPSPRPSPTNMRLSPSPPSISGSSPTYARVSNLKKVNNHSNGNVRNVRFADEHSSSGVSASSATSSSSGPSSIESQKNNLYDETLVVIEKSNKELEKKLEPARHEQASVDPQQTPKKQFTVTFLAWIFAGVYLSNGLSFFAAATSTVNSASARRYDPQQQKQPCPRSHLWSRRSGACQSTTAEFGSIFIPVSIEKSRHGELLFCSSQLSESERPLHRWHHVHQFQEHHGAKIDGGSEFQQHRYFVRSQRCGRSA